MKRIDDSGDWKRLIVDVLKSTIMIQSRAPEIERVPSNVELVHDSPV